MNTNGLARLYDRLTARERLPLIMAASARGDEAEYSRLMRSAPTLTYRVPDYYPLGDGLRLLSLLELPRRLSLAAVFYQALGGAADLKERASADRLCDTAMVLAYLIVTEADGWRRFCAGLSVDPEQLLGGLPGYDTAQAAEEAARPMAFTVEGVTAWRRRTGGGDGPPAVTAEAVAADWARTLDWHVARWG